MNIYADVVSYIKETKKRISIVFNNYFVITVTKKQAQKIIQDYNKSIRGYDDSHKNVFIIELKPHNY